VLFRVGNYYTNINNINLNEAAMGICSDSFSQYHSYFVRNIMQHFNDTIQCKIQCRFTLRSLWLYLNKHYLHGWLVDKLIPCKVAGNVLDNKSLKGQSVTEFRVNDNRLNYRNKFKVQNNEHRETIECATWRPTRNHSCHVILYDMFLAMTAGKCRHVTRH